MLFEKTVVVRAPLQEVWDFLWDTERLASCIQGCEKVEVIEPKSRYAAWVGAKVGPFKVNFAIELEVMEVEALHIKAKAAGKDSSVAASLRADIDLKLKDVSDQRTELDFKTDVTILGKLATLGHWIIKKKADETMSYFVDRIKAQLEKN
jgi:carbon monoxide dehydrogenase subunit G